MNSNRPYLIRALHEWIIDNGMTPQIVVDTTLPGVEVPQHVVENDEVVLNISHSATRDLQLGNDWIMFAARFSGKSHQISVPVDAVRAVFVRENDWHMVLPPEEQDETPDPSTEPPKPETPDPRARLRVVK